MVQSHELLWWLYRRCHPPKDLSSETRDGDVMAKGQLLCYAGAA